MVTGPLDPLKVGELPGTLASSSYLCFNRAITVVETMCARVLLGDHDVTLRDRDARNFVERVRFGVADAHHGHRVQPPHFNTVGPADGAAGGSVIAQIHCD